MDDVDELLTPRDAGTVPGADAWKATTGVLLRRRWWRRGRAGLAMAGCFVAGALVMYRPAPPMVSAPIENVVAIAPKQVEAPIDIVPQPMDSPRRLERFAAIAEGEKQRTLLRRAGDAYLNYGDEVAAARCYRKALDGGSPIELTFNTHDSWMLMSMKLSRKE